MNPANESSRLLETVKKLEARVAALEKILSGSSDSISLRCGGSDITLKRTSIEMESSQVTIRASGDVQIKAGRNIVMKGAKIAAN